MSFTFLAWLTALETYRFANKLGGLQPDAHEPANKSYDIDGAGLSSRSDQVQTVHENAPTNAGAHPSWHAKVEDTKPDGLHENADPNHSVIGSSTDPRILAAPLPSNPTINPVVVGTPALGTIFQGTSVEAPGALVNQPIVLPVAGAAPPIPDTVAPTVPSVAASGSGIDGAGNGDLNAGHVVTLTVSMSEVVTVAGGVPTLSLSNGGTASYTGGSGSTALTFSYTVGAGDDITDLAVTAFNLNGATVSDVAGNSANVAGAVINPTGILQIDTIAPGSPVISNVVLGGIGGNHWVLTGTAEANSTVIVFDGNTQLAAVTASGAGVWNYTTTGSVTNSSVHTFTATASDSAGNTSVPSAAWIEGS